MCKFRLLISSLSVLAVILSSCTVRPQGGLASDPEAPKYLKLVPHGPNGWTAISISPFDGTADTLVIDAPLQRVIVMSSSHYGFLAELDRTDIIRAVSGAEYIYYLLPPCTPHGGLRGVPLRLPASPRSESLEAEVEGCGVEAGLASPDRATLGTVRGGTGAERSGASGGVERSETSGLSEPASCRQNEGQNLSAPADIGYDGAADYEKIVGLRPEVVLTYKVSGAETPFEAKLKQLGIKTFPVHEHLESHPLARASYIRLFGALAGDMAVADSVFSAVRDSYHNIAEEVAAKDEPARKILLNIPYNDQWFVPSAGSYLTAMIRDAGGEVLGTKDGQAASSVMSVEQAYSLSKEADLWLNVGWCRTREQLLSVNPIFADMLQNIEGNAVSRGFGEEPVVWNDNLRVNAKGGNDIWQSGVARPDLVLHDLAAILHPYNEAEEIVYYRPIE